MGSGLGLAVQQGRRTPLLVGHLSAILICTPSGLGGGRRTPALQPLSDWDSTANGRASAWLRIDR